MSHRVTIIIPCRNEAAHVDHAVSDALAQERRGFDIEVLVAVGPSEDDTQGIVERIAAKNPEVVLVENPAGVVPHGLNAAIRLATGDFIVRMDAHSRYPNDYVAVLTEALDRLHADNTGGVWETLPANGSNKARAIAQVVSSPQGVVNARVTDILPAQFANAAWTCSAGPGASCPAAGAGTVDALVSLPAGSSVSFALTATAQAAPEQIVSNRATVTPPPNAPDPVSANNESTDTDPIGIFGEGFETEDE